MRRVILGLALVLVASTISMVKADDDDDNQSHKVRARLSSFNEVHFNGVSPATLRGAISSAASGRFVAEIDEQNKIIHYELSYKNLEGNVLQAHIHFGQRHTVGGIVVWLCQTSTAPAPPEVTALTPGCPAEGKVTGTIVPAQVLAPAGQGIAVGEFNELVKAIRAGATYVNVHSSLFPPGEIRDQISGRDDD